MLLRIRQKHLGGKIPILQNLHHHKQLLVVASVALMGAYMPAFVWLNWHGFLTMLQHLWLDLSRTPLLSTQIPKLLFSDVVSQNRLKGWSSWGGKAENKIAGCAVQTAPAVAASAAVWTLLIWKVVWQAWHFIPCVLGVFHSLLLNILLVSSVDKETLYFFFH